MQKIVVASTNPVKVRATLAGFQAMFPDETFVVETVNVLSGVAAQPFSDAETLQGALQRAEGACAVCPQANYWVGIEGGVEAIDEELGVFAWIVVKSATRLGKGKTGTFFLPSIITELVKAGKELGEADDLVFQRTNSKQKDGSIGILTQGIIDRVELYRPAVIFALIPFKKPELY